MREIEADPRLWMHALNPEQWQLLSTSVRSAAAILTVHGDDQVPQVRFVSHTRMMRFMHAPKTGPVEGYTQRGDIIIPERAVVLQVMQGVKGELKRLRGRSQEFTPREFLLYAVANCATSLAADSLMAVLYQNDREFLESLNGENRSSSIHHLAMTYFIRGMGRIPSK